MKTFFNFIVLFVEGGLSILLWLPRLAIWLSRNYSLVIDDPVPATLVNNKQACDASQVWSKVSYFISSYKIYSLLPRLWNCLGLCSRLRFSLSTFNHLLVMKLAPLRVVVQVLKLLFVWLKRLRVLIHASSMSCSIKRGSRQEPVGFLLHKALLKEGELDTLEKVVRRMSVSRCKSVKR